MSQRLLDAIDDLDNELRDLYEQAIYDELEGLGEEYLFEMAQAKEGWGDHVYLTTRALLRDFNFWLEGQTENDFKLYVYRYLHKHAKEAAENIIKEFEGDKE